MSQENQSRYPNSSFTVAIPSFWLNNVTRTISECRITKIFASSYAFAFTQAFSKAWTITVLLFFAVMDTCTLSRTYTRPIFQPLYRIVTLEQPSRRLFSVLFILHTSSTIMPCERIKAAGQMFFSVWFDGQ